MESAKAGKRGAIVVPAKLRKSFGIEEVHWLTRRNEKTVF